MVYFVLMDVFSPRQCVKNGNNTFVFSGRRERRERIPTGNDINMYSEKFVRENGTHAIASRRGCQHKLGGQFGRRRRGGGFPGNGRKMSTADIGAELLSLSLSQFLFFFSLPPPLPPSPLRRKLHARLLQPAAVCARVRLRVRERRPRHRDLWPRRMINHPELPPPPPPPPRRGYCTHTRARVYYTHTHTHAHVFGDIDSAPAAASLYIIRRPYIIIIYIYTRIK